LLVNLSTPGLANPGDASDGLLCTSRRLPTLRKVLAGRNCDAVRNPRSHFAVPLWFSNAWFGETPSADAS